MFVFLLTLVVMVPSWFLSKTVKASLNVANSSAVKDSRIFRLSASVKVAMSAKVVKNPFRKKLLSNSQAQQAQQHVRIVRNLVFSLDSAREWRTLLIHSVVIIVFAPVVRTYIRPHFSKYSKKQCSLLARLLVWPRGSLMTTVLLCAAYTNENVSFYIYIVSDFPIFCPMKAVASTIEVKDMKERIQPKQDKAGIKHDLENCIDFKKILHELRVQICKVTIFKTFKRWWLNWLLVVKNFILHLPRCCKCCLWLKVIICSLLATEKCTSLFHIVRIKTYLNIFFFTLSLLDLNSSFMERKKLPFCPQKNRPRIAQKSLNLKV